MNRANISVTDYFFYWLFFNNVWYNCSFKFWVPSWKIKKNKQKKPWKHVSAGRCRINKQQCYRTGDHSPCNRCLLLQIFRLNNSQGSSTFKRSPALFIIKLPFHCGRSHLQLFSNNIEPSKGFNRTFAGNKQRCRYNGQWSWGCGGVGEIYGTGRAARWEIVPLGEDEMGVTEKDAEAGKWVVVMEKHLENISTNMRKNSWGYSTDVGVGEGAMSISESRYCWLTGSLML